MTTLHRQVKTALDETRLLILGAQILFGFHLNAVFQSDFPNLSSTFHALYACAFSAMAITVGLLIAPSMQHRIVERGRSDRRILQAATRLAGWALLPLAFSLGADLAIVLGYRFGARAGVITGVTITTLALGLWFVAAWAMRTHAEGETAMSEKITPIDIRVEHMLTEARVLLPGAQALFGFQMAVLLTQGFEQLPDSSKDIHSTALCCIALAIILLMAPAAFHRIAFRGQNTEQFHRLGSALVVASAVPLAAGITGDLYVAVTRALDSPLLGGLVAGGIGLALAVLWFLQPIILRVTHAEQTCNATQAQFRHVREL